MNTNIFFLPGLHSLSDLVTLTHLKVNDKKMSSSQCQKRPCIPLCSLFPCICHMLPLSHLIKHHTGGLAVMADTGMKCTWSRISPCAGSLSSLWLLTVTGWFWKACESRADPQEWTHLHQGLSISSGHVNNLHHICHKPRFRLCRMQSPQVDTVWLIGRCLCLVSHH